jgi:hypothetical protein
MAKTLNTPLHKRQRKDKSHATQLKTIFQYLQTHIATATMVSHATQVPQKCICRYKRDLEKSGLLWEVKKGPCKITGFKAFYITTNPKFATKLNNQLKMF